MSFFLFNIYLTSYTGLVSSFYQKNVAEVTLHEFQNLERKRPCNVCLPIHLGMRLGGHRLGS